MCGIAGVLREDGLLAGEAEQALVERMLRALQHRGPDGSGTCLHGPLALGHARLALTETSAAGAQPIADLRRGWLVSVNGTFHNAAEVQRRFGMDRAGFDCAVLPALLEQHGLAAFTQLEGPFAAALFETGPQRLSLVRGHHGHKPLFYARHQGWFCFASEIAALATVLPALRPDSAAIAQTLRFGWCLPPRSLFVGISTLAPGTALQIVAGQRESTLNLARQDASHDPLTGGLLDHLQRAVDRRFAALVRPAGVLLSGGLDSAAVLLCAARHGATAWCYASADPKLDESSAAQSIAAACGVRLHVLRPELVPHEELQRLTRQCGEALPDPSTLQMSSLCRAIGDEATVLFSGDGGDELLLGYRRHGVARAAAGFGKLLPAALWNLVALCAPSSRHAAGLRALGLGPAAFASLAALAPPAQLSALLSHQAPDERDPFTSHFKTALSEDAAARAGRADLELGLAHGLMTKADRAAMSSSHEIWAPFLDEAVVRHCQALPGSARRSFSRGKLPLRQALAAHLPRAIVNAPKRGFAAPLNAWLQHADTREFAGAMLSAEAAAFEGVLQVPAPRLMDLCSVRALQPVLWAALSVAVALHTAKVATSSRLSA
ncbi:MAG: hypothetical protein EXS14_04305 [Planctomycetes bacterium]|nr:hypothetical protein [Planctomycetota bacterium]